MHLRHVVFGSTLLAALSLSGCQGVLGISDNPQVETTSTCTGTLYVRIASDFSGTATDIAIPHFWGLYDYLRRLNENGGVRGCPVEIDVKDNNYTPAGTTAVVDAWRATDPHWNDVNTLFIFGTGPTNQVGPKLMEEKKVIIPGSYAGTFASPAKVDKTITYPFVNTDFVTTNFSASKTSSGWPYVFYPATDYGTGMRLGIQAAWTIQAGRMAFGHETAEKCAYCVEPLAAGGSFVTALQGMSIGRDIIFPQTSSSADDATIKAAVDTYFSDPKTGEIAHFKEVNGTLTGPSPDYYEPVIWIWSGNSVYATAILAKEIAAMQRLIDADAAVQSILTKVGKTWKIRIMANNWGIGETTTKFCGADCNTDLIYGLFPVPRYADLQNANGMAKLVALHETYAQKDSAAPPPPPITSRKPEDYRDVRYVQGYAAALMWEKAVTRALDTVHHKPSGEDIKNALEKFTQEDMEGMTAGPISFTPTDHRPQSNESIYKLDANGALTFVNRFNIGLVPDWLGY